MQPDRDSLARAYDTHYAQRNHFGYRSWMYRAYLAALVRRAGIEPGQRVLDAGCGQGFFTALFNDMGFDATGVDLSEAGVASARREYVRDRLRFRVGDVLNLPLDEQFDCVFTRSCSLYNDPAFKDLTSVTDSLMRYVRPGGVLIFDYYSRMGKGRTSAWHYHSLQDLRSHFGAYPGAQTFYSLRLEALPLGSLALTEPVTQAARALSALTGIGGELIAIVRKPCAT